MQISKHEKNLGPETEELETEELEREGPQEVPKPEQIDPEETKRRIQEKYAGPLRGWGGDGPGVA